MVSRSPQAKNSLEEISKDDGNRVSTQYLCHGDELFLSYDRIIKDFFSRKQPASFDMLIEYKDKLLCIEFKNSIPYDIKNESVKNKAIEGIAALYKIAQECNLSLQQYKKYYIVIYKPSIANNKTKSQNRLHERAGKKAIDFGLSKYKDTFYDKIITAPCKEYKHIKQRLSIK